MPKKASIIVEVSDKSKNIFQAWIDTLNLSKVAETGDKLTALTDFYHGGGVRVPVGMWNFYPEVGVFSPSNPGEDFQYYGLIDTKKLWDFDSAQNERLSEVLVELLQGDEEDQVLGSVEEIFGLPDIDLEVHPIIIWIEAERQISQGAAASKYDEGLWKTLLFSPKSLFAAPLVLTPQGFEDFAEFEHTYVPMCAVPEGSFEESYKEIADVMLGTTSGVDSLALIPDPLKDFALGSFTAHYRSGAKTLDPVKGFVPLTEKEIVQVNTIELIKGDPEGVPFFDTIGEYYPEIEGDSFLDDVRDQLIATGSFSSRLAKTVYRNASKKKGFRDRRYSLLMSLSMVKEETPVNYEQLVFNSAKALIKTMNQFLTALK